MKQIELKKIAKIAFTTKSNNFNELVNNTNEITKKCFNQILNMKQADFKKAYSKNEIEINEAINKMYNDFKNESIYDFEKRWLAISKEDLRKCINYSSLIHF